MNYEGFRFTRDLDLWITWGQLRMGALKIMNELDLAQPIH